MESDRAEQVSQLASENLADLEEKFEEATMIRDDLDLVGEDIHNSEPESDRSSLADDLRRLQKQESELRTDRDRAEIRLRDAERELSKARAGRKLDHQHQDQQSQSPL